MKKLSKNTLIFLNFLICVIPLAFILGNFFINAIITIFCITGIFFYKNNIFRINKNKISAIFFIFFLIVITATIFEGYNNPKNLQFTKSILFLRYFIFLLILSQMIINNDLNIKLFIKSCLFFSILVSLDIILQYFYGKNILGYEAEEHRRSGLFGDEIIAGGYIQRFSIFGLFALPYLLKKTGNKIFLYLSFFIIIFLGAFLSGNRMPLIMFLFFILLLSLTFNLKKLKFIGQISLALLVSIFIFLVTNFDNFKINYQRFLGGIPNPAKIINELKKNYPELKKYEGTKTAFHQTEEAKKNVGSYETFDLKTGHIHLYITSLDLISDDPFIGRGIRSFRNTCWEKRHLPNRLCQNHAHNFYLEILNDTGFLGLALIVLPLFYLIIKCFKKYRKKNYLFFYPVFFSLIIEFFPFRSSGSFFSTYNSTFIFFLIGLLIGMNELKKKNLLKSSNIF